MIYTSPNSRIFTLSVRQGTLSADLGWVPNAVVVDNYTSQYLSILQLFVPPFTVGKVLDLTNYRGTTAAATFAAPPGILQIAPNLDQVAQLTYYEAPIPANSGFLLQASVGQPVRPPDWQLNDVLRVLTVPGSQGQRVLVNEIIFTLINNGAGGPQNAACRVWSDVSGTGTLLWNSRGFIQGVQSADRVYGHSMVGLRANGILIADYDQAPNAGNSFFITANGWYVT